MTECITFGHLYYFQLKLTLLLGKNTVCKKKSDSGFFSGSGSEIRITDPDPGPANNSGSNTLLLMRHLGDSFLNTQHILTHHIQKCAKKLTTTATHS